jgi:predicted metal-binding protein
MIHVTLCADCNSGQTSLAERLNDALQNANLNAKVTMGACMSGCGRPSTIAFRTSGKTAYLFGEITQADLHELTTFAKHYETSPDGNFSDARILGGLRFKAIARIPG